MVFVSTIQTFKTRHYFDCWLERCLCLKPSIHITSNDPQQNLSKLEQGCGNSKSKFSTHNVLVQRTFYLSQRANNAQTTSLSPYCTDAKCKLFFENGIMKPDINSYEFSVDPDQLASSKAS